MDEHGRDNRARVNFIKRLLVSSVVIIIPVLIILCIFLVINNIALRKEITDLKIKSEGSGYDGGYDETSGVYSVSDISVKGSGTTDNDGIDTYGDGIKRIYLTFDDGPGANTDDILDILKENDVKATFFVVGRNDEHSLEMYKRIVDEGHTLGLHSYSHKYNEIYASIDAFADDIRSLQELLYETTGVWPRFYRFPGGSSTTTSVTPISDLIDYLNEQDIVYFDWNIVSGDAVDNPPDKDTIVKNCLRGIDKYDECVILMHDLTEKRSTVEALRILIPKLLEMEDVEILPITDDTIPVQHVPAQSIIND
ncbi:MAG: polysaccharide deacetylase [Lachnospiraceae bacterium]|nr:polysaccharide deacetylase [Lachnospiraceae bacterium]